MRKVLGDQVKLIARRFGIVVSWYPPLGSFERELRDYLDRNQINCVLDVGAFTGQYALLLRRLGYSGRIVSFEPVEGSYIALCGAMGGDQEWVGQPYGLSDEEREAEINTYGDRGDFNSLYRLKGDAHAMYSVPHSSKCTVQLRRLDKVLPLLLEGIGSPRVFLKMDTQGHDLSVFCGAQGVLNVIIGMQSEVPVIELYDGMPAMSDVLARYTASSFYPVSFHRVNLLKNGLAPEFDVILHRATGEHILVLPLRSKR